MGMNPAECVWKVANTANSNLYRGIKSWIGRARGRAERPAATELADWRSPILTGHDAAALRRASVMIEKFATSTGRL
jgi:hypothetical protein